MTLFQNDGAGPTPVYNVLVTPLMKERLWLVIVERKAYITTARIGLSRTRSKALTRASRYIEALAFRPTE